MNAETFCEHFATFAEAPNAIAKLRELILQLAVQGNLGTQDESDEPASELLKNIQLEKARLLKDGAIKRLRNAGEEAGTRPLLAMPPGWALTTLGEIAIKITDGTHKTPTYIDRGIPFVSVKDFSGGWLDFSNTRFISPEEHEFLYKRSDPRRGDILIARIGTLGKAVLVDSDIEFSVFVSVGLIRFSHEFIAPDFLRLLLNSPHAVSEFDRIKVGGGSHTNKLNLGDLHTIVLPLPPLAEQRRIVGKVDQLLGLCDELAARQAARREARSALVGATLDRLVSARSAAEFPAHAHRLRDHFDRLFDTPTTLPQLRQAILQLAVQGQLVPQDPTDEPAPLQSNDAEDRKSGPIAGDDEPSTAWPFDVPTKWRWLRLRDTPVSLKYGTSVKCDYEGNGVPVLRIPNVVGGRIDIDDLKYGELTDKEQSDLRLEKGDLLLIRSNGSTGIVGRTAVVDDDAVGFAYAGYLVRVRYPAATWFPEFLHLAMISQATRNQIEGPIRTTSGVKNINSTEIGRLMLPLPPLSEQKRIVSKVTELLSLCDALEAKLTQAESASTQLLSAAVHHLLST